MQTMRYSNSRLLCNMSRKRKVQLHILEFGNYRVSIKYFPDDKHLLQENYVEYKHIFFFNIT